MTSRAPRPPTLAFTTVPAMTSREKHTLTCLALIVTCNDLPVLTAPLFAAKITRRVRDRRTDGQTDGYTTTAYTVLAWGVVR